MAGTKKTVYAGHQPPDQQASKLADKAEYDVIAEDCKR